MKLKLFIAKRTRAFSGGMIAVAAHTVEEAHDIFVEWAKKYDRFELYNEYTYSDGYVSKDDEYPLRNWREVYGVSLVCDAPSVIDEDSYAE